MSKLFTYLLLVSVILSNIDYSKKYYVKKYFENGILDSEGWMRGNNKTNYWYKYETNGNLKSKGNFLKNKKNGYWYYYNVEEFKSIEGFYKNGSKTGWWTFIKKNRTEIKMEYLNDKKNGLVLFFEKGRSIPYKAEKFENDKKIGSWTTLSDFKKDNPDIKY